MARIQPVEPEKLSPAVQVAVNRHLEYYNDRITNAKATLAHSLLAFEAYMQWYPLYEQVEIILGKRMAYLFAFAISKATQCVPCVAYFQKRIADAGENPDRLILTEPQQCLLVFGAGVARHQGKIADHLYNDVARQFTEQEMVTLVAFAGQMVAVNVFNNVVETEIDPYLQDHLFPSKLY